jgi:hypothetical protein
VIDSVRQGRRNRSLAYIVQQSYPVSILASRVDLHSVCDLGVLHLSTVLSLASTCRQIPSRAEHSQHTRSISKSIGGYMALFELLDG